MKMSMKKWISLFLAVLLLCVSGTVLGESAYTLEKVAGGFSSAVAIPKTHYVLVQKSSSWGVINTDGKMQCPTQFAYLSYLSYDCLETAKKYLKTKEELLAAREGNQLGLVTVQGKTVSDCAYGYFQIYNAYWATAWVLEAGTEEDFDYKADNTHFYRIARCDLFSLGIKEEKGPVLVASFTRDEFLRAAGHDRYVSVQDRQEKVTIYDTDGNAYASDANNASVSVFKIKYLAIVNGITGELIASPYVNVREAQTENGMLLIAAKSDFSGNAISSILDLDGQVLMPDTYASVSSVTEDYALLQENGLFGLYSLAEQRLLVPCEYDSIIKNGVSVDPYVSKGFIGAMKDGEVHILSAKTGETVRTFVIKENWRMSGLLYYRQTKSQVHYYSPDGHHEDPVGSMSTPRGSGYLVALKIEGRYCVYNWYGEKLIKAAGTPFAITDDDSVIGREDSSYVIYKLKPKQ